MRLFCTSSRNELSHIGALTKVIAKQVEINRSQSANGNLVVEGLIIENCASASIQGKSYGRPSAEGIYFQNKAICSELPGNLIAAFSTGVLVFLVKHTKDYPPVVNVHWFGEIY